MRTGRARQGGWGGGERGGPREAIEAGSEWGARQRGDATEAGRERGSRLAGSWSRGGTAIGAGRGEGPSERA